MLNKNISQNTIIDKTDSEPKKCCSEHEHHHDHDHPHDHGHTGLEERVAMLTYMLGHNQHHAQELHELAHDLGDSEAAQLIHDAVVDFEVGNKKLAEALAVLKGE